MKHFFTTVFLLGFFHSLEAQEPATIEQYSMARIFWNAFAGEASIAIDDGTKEEAMTIFSQRLRDSSKPGDQIQITGGCVKLYGQTRMEDGTCGEQ